MIIQGKWYNSGSAAQYEAQCKIENNRCQLTVANEDIISYPLEDIQVSDRLGNTERKLTFKDGSVFATYDNDQIDAFFKHHNPISAFIHTIENRMSWVISAVIVTVIAVLAFFKWGVPWAGHTIAHALPHQTNELISKETFYFLDKYIFEKSELTPERQIQLSEHFSSLLTRLNEDNKDIQYKLHFRAWNYDDLSIPNALALPSGDIVLTDKFVELSQNQDEIDSVLLHEIGHVIHRHSLEMLVESTLMTASILLVTGDMNWFVDAGIGLGTLLISSQYSQNSETEADIYSFEKMLILNIDPMSFSSIITRISQFSEDMEIQKKEADKKETDNKKTGTGNQMIDYFSSHPSTQQRVELAQKYSECFKKRLKVCH